jgi:hypothetical protein
MADTALVTDEQVQQPESHRPHEMTINSESLASKMWGVEEQASTVAPIQEEKKPEVVAPVTETKIQEIPKEEVFDEADYIKKQYGYETAETLKQDLDNYKKLKEAPAEKSFENEQSKTVYELLKSGKIDDVVEFYQTQKKINTLTGAEVNANSAEEIIKLGMQLSNKLLTKEDIDFKYKQEYGLSKQPVQKLSETDEDFTERMDEWKERAAMLEMKKVVDAKMAVPQLEQLKQKIVLPEIENKPIETPKQRTQEELDAAVKYNEAYIKSVDASVKDLNGFSVKVKNEDIGLPETEITYSVIDAEKNILSQQMKDFVNANYDANALFADRWVNGDNTLNTSKIAEDRYLLDNRDRIFQKLAEDSANKAVEAYIKGKKNINIKDTHTTQTEDLTNEKSVSDVAREKFFG